MTNAESTMRMRYLSCFIWIEYLQCDCNVMLGILLWTAP